MKKRWRLRTCRTCAEQFWNRGETWYCGECVALIEAVAASRRPAKRRARR